MSENDAQTELKKRARRRLVGAIALAVLAAIVLPMVMDQAPRQAAQDIRIRIPSQDAGAFTSRILPVKPGGSPAPLPTAPAPESAATELPKPADAPARPESNAATKTEQKTVAARAEASSGNIANKPAETPTASMANGKPPATSPKEARTGQAQAGGAGEQWVVQLGAYREQGNVRNLTAKLKQQGYNSYTEVLSPPDGISKTRVRAGPFPTREAAEAARIRIKRIGVDGVVAQK